MARIFTFEYPVRASKTYLTDKTLLHFELLFWQRQSDEVIEFLFTGTPIREAGIEDGGEAVVMFTYLKVCKLVDHDILNAATRHSR